jgi:hypothetical protein
MSYDESTGVISGDVEVSALAGNAINVLADGLYVTPAAVSCDDVEACVGIKYCWYLAETEADLIAIETAGVGGIAVGASITLTTNLTVTIPITVLPCGLIITDGNTLTINNTLIADQRYILDAAVGEVIFNASAAPQIFPEWWGATGDGVTDDTLAVEAAIEASGVSRIPVWFSQEYVVSEADLESGCTLDGTGTIIKKAGTVTYALATTGVGLYTDITIRNIKINGNKANCTAGGCLAVSGKDILIENCTLYDPPNACINLGYRAGGKNIRVIKNICKDSSLPNENWGAIGVTGGTNVVISENVIECTDGNQAYGISIEPDVGTPTDAIGQIIISNNVIRGGRVYVDGVALAGTLKDVLVHNNFIDARGSDLNGFTNEAQLFLRQT